MIIFKKLLGYSDTKPAAEANSEDQDPQQPDEPISQHPWQSPLKLTSELEERMVRHAKLRIAQVRLEMGLTTTNDIMPGSWMDIRWRHTQSYENDYSWRIAMGSIFEKSNFTIGSGQRHVRYLGSRIQDDLLGTSPFFSALARWPSKEETARQLEEFIQSQIEPTNIQSKLRESQKRALIVNEAVVKTVYAYESSNFIGQATVYVGDDGQPIVTPNGAYIYEGEDFQPDPTGTTDGLLVMVNDPAVKAFQSDQGLKLVISTSDGVQTTNAQLQYFDELPQTLVKYDGVRAETLDYRAFLCPLRFDSIHDADICVHLYQSTPNKLKATYGDIDVSAGYFDFWAAPGASHAKYEQGETDGVGSVVALSVQCAECFMTFDPFDDGRDMEIFLVLDMRNEKPVYYNYLANHYKRRPFDVVPGLEKIPNRWYGRGIYGMCEDQFLYEDAQFNRLNFKDTKEASMTFAHMDAVEEWQNGVSPQVGGKDIYWIRSGWDAQQKPPIFRTRLTEDMKDGYEMLDMMRQAEDGIIGSISLKDASASDMAQSKTATGDVTLTQQADVITRATEFEQTQAIQSILDLTVDLMLEHMKPQVLVYRGQEKVAMLSREEARNLTRNVRLLLTRSRSTQLFQTSQTIIQLGMQYQQLLQTNPNAAKVLRPAFINEAKALQYEDVDELFPEVTDEMLQQFAQSSAQGSSKPPSESISIKYPDLARSEQIQILQKAGITPASPEELGPQMMPASPNGNLP